MLLYILFEINVKVIKLDWTNPGRIDPKLYFSAKTIESESVNEESKETNSIINGNNFQNVVSKSEIDINK